MKKIPTTWAIQVDAYRVMEEAVERGISIGWRRAHKHVESPDEVSIKDAVEQAVMNELCEYFKFGHE